MTPLMTRKRRTSFLAAITLLPFLHTPSDSLAIQTKAPISIPNAPRDRSPGEVLAKLADLNFDTMGIKQGLPHDSIYGFAEDDKGFLWIATFGGLSRFDGYRLQNYLHDPNNRSSLPDNNIRLILPRSSGGLWIATGNAGVIRYEASSDRFFPLPNLPASLKRSHVFCMTEDKEGTLWFGSQLGLARYSPKNGKYEIYGKAAEKDNPSDFTLGSVFSVFTDSRGNLWVGGDTGILMRPFHEKRFIPIWGRDGADQIGEKPSTWTIFEDHQHRIWIGTDTTGMGRFNPETNRVEGVPGMSGYSSFVGAHTIRGIVEVKPNVFWIATYGNGLVIYNTVTGEREAQQRDLTSSAPLSNNFIRGIFQDRMGLIWLGTDRGLSRLNATAEGLLNIHSSPMRTEGLIGNEVRSVTAQGNRIWVGFDKGQFAVIEPDGKIQKVLPYPGVLKDQQSQREVLAIKAADEHEVYAGGVGLFRIDMQRRLYQPVPNPLLSKQVINTLMIDGPDVWAGTYNGLVRYNRRTKEAKLFAHEVRDPNSLSDNYVRDILKSADGRIWITTRLGLDRYDPSTEKFQHIRHDPKDPTSLPNDNIQPIAEDLHGRLWIGTIGDGLTVLWNWTKEGRPVFRTLNRQNGFPGDIVLTVMKGKDGRIWSNTPGGLAVVNPDTLELNTYLAADGLKTTAQNLFSSATLRDGTILFPGDEGLVVVRPEKLAPKPLIAPLVITGVSLPGSKLAPTALADLALRDGLFLNKEDRAFQINFALLDYASPQTSLYRHTLEGFDKSWTPWSPETRSATYTNLPPGNYRLIIQAKGRLLTQPTAQIVVNVNVPAFWYETRWFTALELLFVLGVIFIVVRVRTAVLRKRESDLEQEVQQRTRELLVANKQLLLLATQDPLTGILNRRCFIEKAEGELERLHRNPGVLSLLLLDIDHFKSINDTYGHAAGDEIIRTVARRIESQLRTTDVLARYGGEEFVVLLPSTSITQAQTLAERLRACIADEQIPFENGSTRVTISLGVAESNGSEKLQYILGEADAALYRAKGAGRNRVSLATAQHPTY